MQINWLLSEDTHLRADDKGHQRNGNHDVDPHEPAQEGEVGGHAGAEVGLDLLDAQLPGYEDGEEAGRLPLPVSPALGADGKSMSSRSSELCTRLSGELQAARLQVRSLIGFPARQPESAQVRITR